MSIWTFLKVFCDVSVCFAVLAAFPNVFPYDGLLVWPALLCAAGAGLASWFRERGKWGLGILCLVLPLSALLIPGQSSELLLLTPAVAYTAVVILRAELTLEYYAFRQYFKNSLIGLLCFALAMGALAYLDRPMDSIENFDWEAVLYYGMLHAAAGVVLLRQLRLGAEGKRSRGMDRRQSLLLLGGTGAVVLGIVALEKWLHRSLMDLLRTLFSVLVSPLLMLYNWFGDRGMDIIGGLTGKDPWQPQQTPGASLAPMPMESVPPETAAPAEPQESFPWLMVLVLCAVAVVLVCLLQGFRRQAKEIARAEILEELPPEDERKEKYNASNRAKIRQYYREFLKTERKRGQKLRTDQTSLDILQGISKQTDERAAAWLRQVYLAARYDGGLVTQEQVREARTALKKTRRGQ